MKAPPHPADFLNEVLMPATGRSDGEIARLLGISLPVFYTILTREKPITRSTAEMLGRLFRTGVTFWLQMQADYDRHAAPQIVAEAEAPHGESLPAQRAMREDDGPSMQRLPKPVQPVRRPVQDSGGIGITAQRLPALEILLQAGQRRAVE